MYLAIVVTTYYSSKEKQTTIKLIKVKVIKEYMYICPANVPTVQLNFSFTYPLTGIINVQNYIKIKFF